LNRGICKALGRAFTLYNDVLEKLLLESTGTDDAMLAAILGGLQEQSKFKAITYKKNSLDLVSIRSLIKLVQRPMPGNLDVLRIINCRMSQQAVEELVTEIQGANSNIRRLSLVKARIQGGRTCGSGKTFALIT